MKEFIFTLGLPGCGKSTYIGKKYVNAFNYDDWNESGMDLDQYCAEAILEHQENGKETIAVIAADEIKRSLPGYTNEHPETVHEWSVQLAKRMVLELADSEWYDGTVLMDGGGINNHYTYDIIKYVKDRNIKVKCIWFDTPLNVCLDRISTRDRKVPVKIVYDKAGLMGKCVDKYKGIVDEMVRVPYYTNKYIMLDMDGTVCSYIGAETDYYGNVDFVNNEFFLHLNPVNHIINFVKEHYNMDNVYICTAVPNCISWKEKNMWLDKYFPEVKQENRLFCGNKDYKYIFVKQFAEHEGWNTNDVVLVDDYHHTIEKCKEIGINCIHPSNIESLNTSDL